MGKGFEKEWIHVCMCIYIYIYMYVYIYIQLNYCYTPETNTTWLINYTPI